VTQATAGASDAQAAVDAALARLYRFHPKRIDLSLGRLTRLLAALGDPHTRLPPVLHVAGTNGKGSVVAFARAMLEAAGHRVHAYTSPHLVRFNERIRLAGDLIADDHLVDVLERCETANGEAPVTYFEVTTAAAFLAFAEMPADALLLEVGLGGRLDATNVVDRPAATAITRISMDHMQFLGETLAAIAAEKAGIVKPGVPLVVGPQAAGPDGAGVLDVIGARAAAAGAPMLAPGRDWTVVPAADGFRLTADGPDRRFPAPALPGRHQLGNAATAILAAERFAAAAGLALDDAAIRRGLAEVAWPARLQRLTRGPLAGALPAGAELWLDGGHNDSAGQALADWLAARAGDDRRPVHLICGMLESKAPVDFLAPLARHAESLTAVAIPGEPASLTAEEMAGHARRAGIERVALAADPAEALAALPPAPARVLICGSLYLAGAVLRETG
jgi:dihydrofolate synthase/folylpolyglutamate synthase